MVLALSVPAAGTEALRANFATLEPKLASSPFGRPLLLESSEAGGKVRGEVFSLVQHSFRQIRTALDTSAEWCEVLILHLNVKACVARSTTAGSWLQLTLGAKRASRDDDSHRIDFRFKVPASSADRFEVTLQADAGPLGTHDYRLSLEATPIASGQSFLRLAYSYTYGTTARLAMNTYLHTLGKDKVGFTVIGHGADGAPVYVGGLRGALERNTMRYYLGIETVLASAAQPPAARRRWRLGAWFDATEKYARQLHELTRAEYLAGKESGLQRTASTAADTL